MPVSGTCYKCGSSIADMSKPCQNCNTWQTSSDSSAGNTTYGAESTNVEAGTTSYVNHDDAQWNNRPLEGSIFDTTPAAAPILTFTDHFPPDRIDLRPLCSPVEDQGMTNSCTAQAIVGALEYHQRKAGLSLTDLSRLFVYYNARKISGAQDQHVGVSIAHVMASVLAYGACKEGLWPFDEAQVLNEPSEEAYINARNYEAVQYARAPLGASALSAIASGLPIVFNTGFTMDFYLEAAMTGSMPVFRENTYIPPRPKYAHAMLIVGYDLPAKYWIVRNSWGPKFADGGYFRIPFSSLEAYSDPEQFWVIGAIEQTSGLSLTGLTMEQAQQQNLDEMRKNLRNNLNAEIEDAKLGIRARLRGK